jgi:hypothetical protein
VDAKDAPSAGINDDKDSPEGGSKDVSRGTVNFTLALLFEPTFPSPSSIIEAAAAAAAPAAKPAAAEAAEVAVVSAEGEGRDEL